MEESPIYLAFVFLVILGFSIYVLVDYLNGREKTKAFNARVDEDMEKERQRLKERDAAEMEAALQEQKAIQESQTAASIQSAKDIIRASNNHIDELDISTSDLSLELERNLFYATSSAIFSLELELDHRTRNETLSDVGQKIIQSEIVKHKKSLENLSPLERLKKIVGDVDGYIAKSTKLIEESHKSSYPGNLHSLDAAFNQIAPFFSIHDVWRNNYRSSPYGIIRGFYENSEEIKEWREKLPSIILKLKLGYENVLNKGIPEPNIAGVVHLVAYCLDDIFAGGSYVVWKPHSNLSVFDNSIIDILGQKSSRKRNSASNYHTNEAEQLLQECFRRNAEDKLVVEILCKVHILLGRNNKVSREVAYLWSQIESNNLRKPVQKITLPVPTSAVSQGVAFEERCTRLFEAMGYTVKQTAMTGDGGIDLELVDNTPIKGGSMIVQCKDWRTQTVGVSVVRDLFGLVVSESKNKGIVVTSGKFTKESEDFAEDKTIELIDGTALAALEREHISTNAE